MNRTLWTAALLVCVALPIGAQSPIDFGMLTARTDSFVVVVQGNVLGFHRMVIERTETGFRVVDDVQITPVMTQRTEIELAGDGALRSTRQTGQVRGHDTRIDIAYADGRAKGSATVPTVAGAHTIIIDTTVAAGTIDDNLITALLSALPWTPTARFTIPVFLSGKGETQGVTLAVKATESITVPAGTFDVYRVELAGGPAPVAMYVTMAPPHRLVKVAPQGTPLEFLLVR